MHSGDRRPPRLQWGLLSIEPEPPGSTPDPCGGPTRDAELYYCSLFGDLLSIETGPPCSPWTPTGSPIDRNRISPGPQRVSYRQRPDHPALPGPQGGLLPIVTGHPAPLDAAGPSIDRNRSALLSLGLSGVSYLWHRNANARCSDSSSRSDGMTVARSPKAGNCQGAHFPRRVSDD